MSRRCCAIRRIPLPGAEHVIDKPRRGTNASRRAAGLDQDRVAPWQRHDAEGTLDLEEPADMVDRSHFGGVGDEAVKSVTWRTMQ
jgi:hypothetical protein